MLHVTDLSFRHGERVLFDRASMALSDGWKVGLVGRNGAGKSTLLRLIQGQIEADGGSIGMTGRMRIGSVPQDPPGGDIPVLDAVRGADMWYWIDREIAPDLDEVGRRLVRAFDVRERPFHFEFFRRPDGSLAALEVNMRQPGGITVDHDLLDFVDALCFE